MVVVVVLLVLVVLVLALVVVVAVSEMVGVVVVAVGCRACGRRHHFSARSCGRQWRDLFFCSRRGS